MLHIFPIDSGPSIHEQKAWVTQQELNCCSNIRSGLAMRVRFETASESTATWLAHCTALQPTTVEQACLACIAALPVADHRQYFLAAAKPSANNQLIAHQ